MTAFFYITTLGIFGTEREEKSLSIITVKSCNLESFFKCIHISLSFVTNLTKYFGRKTAASKLHALTAYGQYSFNFHDSVSLSFYDFNIHEKIDFS